jgi:dynactin-4
MTSLDRRLLVLTEQFDLEIRFTYRVEEEGEEPAEEGKEEFKTFTFWTRMSAGQVA